MDHYYPLQSKMLLIKYIYQIVSKYIISIFILLLTLELNVLAKENSHIDILSILGPKVSIKTDWKGRLSVDKSISILVLAGHADSQGIAGAGTAGEGVDLLGMNPMNQLISDELYWNMLIRDEIVRIGKRKGLNINSYDPIERNIVDGNNPKTNWSKGSLHSRKGGYAIEIHFDSYGQYGFGSGLIPAFSTELNTIDESLANCFGRYPIFFRGGLGGPRRGIRILEIGKLEGKLEAALRSSDTREIVIKKIASLVVEAIANGISASQS